MIPKVIYQTWKTKELPLSIQTIRQQLQERNPQYTLVLFDDNDIDIWMKTNMSPDIVQAYSELNVGAAKADFWRYCILYTNGGVYLDIDSDIHTPLDLFIKEDDTAVLSRESNKGTFLQWLMIFTKGHPILKTTIEIVTKNIQNRQFTDIVQLTGPFTFTTAIHTVLLPHYTHACQLWFEEDEELNLVFTTNTTIQCRFLGIDFATSDHRHASWKHLAADDLYKTELHWSQVKTIFKT